MKGPNVRFAMGQLLVEGGEPERNLGRAEKMIGDAAAQRCDLILLPEVLDLGWTHPSAKDEALPIPGPRTDQLAAAAAKHNIWVCAGLTEDDHGTVYNSAVLIDNHGKLMLKYRKINLLQVELPFYTIGTMLNAVDTPFGRVGLNICADNYYTGLHIGHALARMGSQIIVSPSSWTVDYCVTEEDDPYGEKWLKPYRILAEWYNLVILGTTCVGYIVGGPYEGKKMVGVSLCVSREGLLARGEMNEFAGEVVVAQFDVPHRAEQGTAISDMLLARGYRFDERPAPPKQ